MKRPVVIIGAGGHARVVADALLLSGTTLAGFVDADRSLHLTTVLGLPVLGGDEALNTADLRDLLLVNGIGGTGGVTRRRIQQRIERDGRQFVGVRHPSAIVSPFARIANDVQLLARAVVQPNAEIAEGCVLNTGAVIEHDCTLESYVHIAPGAILCGGVRVGEESHIGAGAIIRENISMGPRTIVGAGAVVVADHPGGATMTGVPAVARVSRGDLA